MPRTDFTALAAAAAKRTGAPNSDEEEAADNQLSFEDAAVAEGAAADGDGTDRTPRGPDVLTGSAGRCTHR
ncbi:hypothetical protein [Streptomyces yangpuensis]|uniref:hypothetical protein n=1 Tax=Streptomyces yangpuensis TaxID=1648182 RepID=UPI0038002019